MDSRDLDKIARRLASGAPGRTRTAGKIEFVKDSGPVRRDIRVEGFQWTPEGLRNLAKILWAAQRAHSYAIAAYRTFSKMPSAQFSPDGLLGGRGYIQAVKDMRQALATAVETMSSFTDTVHDEINAEHWKAPGSDEQVSGIVQDAEKVKANPEGFVEGEFRQDENQPFDPSSAAQLSDAMEEAEQPVRNPDPEDFGEDLEDEEEDDDEEEDEDEDEVFSQVASEAFADAKDLKKILKKGEPEEPGSKLPGAGGEQGQGKTAPEITMNTTSPDKGSYASSIARILRAQEARTASARSAGGSSSIDVESLPGPRVEHVGPGESGTESGGYGDGWGSDDPSGDGLSSGTNMTNPVYEEWTMDGVTGDDNPTDGDSTVLKVSSRLSRVAVEESYSWLPGASNDRNLNYYEPGLSDADVEWMRQNAAPKLPPGIVAPDKKFDSRTLWDVDL